MINVVAGIICNTKQEFLISLRPAHAIQGNIWEFPGGKIEAGETPYQALVRELHEEVDIQVIAAHPFDRIHYAYPEREVELHVWWVDEFTGVAHGKEGQIIRWVTADVLSTLPFPAGNQPIIEVLNSKHEKGA